MPANDADALKAALDVGNVCALLIETIQGEGGVNCLTEEYIRAAREMTEAARHPADDRRGADRQRAHRQIVQLSAFRDSAGCGLHRQGSGGRTADGCVPLSEKAADVLTPGTHGSTFGGNPVCAAAALYVQDRLTDELWPRWPKRASGCGQNLRSFPV